MTNLVKCISQCVLQREVFCLQRGVVALQLLQTSVHDVQDGALYGPHGWGQRHMELHHFWLVPVQCCVHRCLESVASRRLQQGQRGQTVSWFSLVGGWKDAVPVTFHCTWARGTASWQRDSSSHAPPGRNPRQRMWPYQWRLLWSPSCFFVWTDGGWRPPDRTRWFYEHDTQGSL